ncbi:MAG: tryptophan 2,3-dioxygenase [Pseudomonadota bacterium]
MSDSPPHSRDGAETDFASRMSYSDYLKLDALLHAQCPLSDAHDEMLFIVQHQTTELWMRLALHELDAARRAIRAQSLRPAFKMITRVARIFEQMNSAWDVLRTLTPNEYAAFRDELGKSSGFQSWQYRLIEFMVGNRDAAMLRPHAHDAQVVAELEAELAQPSLYDDTVRVLAERGFAVPENLLGRDLHAPWHHSLELEAIWREVYRDNVQHWDLYELAEKLVDFEDYFRRWRFNHVTTVERVIGFRRGTGGTAGVSYLKRMLDVELFPELWRMRTEI